MSTKSAGLVRVHRPLVNGVVRILTSVVEEGYPTDKSIERVFKANAKWGARDRRFIAETVYECVRWWIRLDHLAGQMGIGHTVEDLVQIYGALRGWDTEIAESESGVTDTPRELWEETERSGGAVRHGLPGWLDELGRQEIGERWDREMLALNEVAPVDLRANALKATPKEVISRLAEDGVEARQVKTNPESLTLVERKNIFSSKAFQAGMFEVQDRSSQRVAHLLDPQPGDRVIDACAGAGGKSLHIAALMKNKGRVVALDIHERKLEELRKRARRAGAGICETRLVDTTKVVKRLAQSADRVLLDVPCTGLGVLRRNPDTKLKLTPDDVSRLQKTQTEILNSYSNMVKPGGILVYSTCSILPSENMQQVEAFCSRHPDFVVDEYWTAWPSDRNGDGFFATRFRRKQK